MKLHFLCPLMIASALLPSCASTNRSRQAVLTEDMVLSRSLSAVDSIVAARLLSVVVEEPRMELQLHSPAGDTAHLSFRAAQLRLDASSAVGRVVHTADTSSLASELIAQSASASEPASSWWRSVAGIVLLIVVAGTIVLSFREIVARR